MSNKILIAPSILSADFGRLNEEIASVEPYCDWISVDVMDGHFVPNITVGMPVVKNLKTKLPIECHLMIEHPERYVEAFIKAGAQIVSVHYETLGEQGEQVREVLGHIRDLGAKASLAIKPATSVLVCEPFLDLMDCAVVMSVEPGFGGQKFMPEALDKIRWLREHKPELDIIVDGGMNAETAKLCREAGANVLVAGSYVFGAADRKAVIESLRA
ncbi:ribulose-phosphate 3-epimerase [Candidatus Peregrinibacteria bacterium]|nr:MAG: ribulose-phosphate 3-epimerase [Candidatus Peregrinibacteria bacterium]